MTGDVEEQQVEEVEENPLEVLFPDKELEEDPLDQEVEEEEGREFAKEQTAKRRVIRCVIIFNLSSWLNFDHTLRCKSTGTQRRDKLCLDTSDTQCVCLSDMNCMPYLLASSNIVQPIVQEQVKNKV